MSRPVLLAPTAFALMMTFACKSKPTDTTNANDEGTWRDPVAVQPDEKGVYQLEMKATKVTVAGRDLCLRTYNGTLSPLIDISASNAARRVRVDFHNAMTTMDEKPVSGTACTETALMHHFNVTNLHTHGLHVSPAKTMDGQFQSDNVLLELHPGSSERYRFDLDEPAAHPAGTFWFHSHVHGSTAIQVANGVAGALIVRGNVDELPALKNARERIFLFQQIPFDDASVKPLIGECNDASLSIDDFSLAIAAKRTLVNGVLAPTIVVPKGQVERWRFIHAGISQEIGLTFRRSEGGKCALDQGGTPVAVMRQIAADGITYRAAEPLNDLLLDPGYRADVMMQAPEEPGTYCIFDAAADLGLNGSEDQNLVAYLEVTNSPATTTLLPSDPELAAIARPVLDCATPLATPIRRFVFAQQKDTVSGQLCEGQCPKGQPIFNLDCQEYQKTDAPLPLPFGKVEEWHLSSELSDHPYHIHVNAFTVCTGSVVHGAPVTTPHWKDTLFVRKADTALGSGVDAATTTPIRIRTHYENFKGKFVMHCHKLQHEDEGMMRALEVQ